MSPILILMIDPKMHWATRKIRQPDKRKAAGGRSAHSAAHIVTV